MANVYSWSQQGSISFRKQEALASSLVWSVVWTERVEKFSVSLVDFPSNSYSVFPSLFQFSVDMM